MMKKRLLICLWNCIKPVSSDFICTHPVVIIVLVKRSCYFKLKRQVGASDTYPAVDVEEQCFQTRPRDFYCKSGYNLLFEEKKAAKYYFEGEPIHMFLDITQTTQIWSRVLCLLNLNRFSWALSCLPEARAEHSGKENPPFNFPFFSYLH